MKLDCFPAASSRSATGNPDVGMGVLTIVQRVIAQALEIDPSFVRVRRGNTPKSPSIRASAAAARRTSSATRRWTARCKLRRLLEAHGFPQAGWEEATAALLRAGPVSLTGNYDAEESEHEPEWTGVSLNYVDLSVDAQTGAITVHEVLAITDAGTVINPVGYRGQVNGGFIFGVGHALTEELRVDGGRIVNLNLGDYKLPTQMDTPPFRYVSIKAQTGPGPFGAKSVGELTTSGVAPAFANAVADACGARITELPITAERIFEELRHP